MRGEKAKAKIQFNNMKQSIEMQTGPLRAYNFFYLSLVKLVLELFIFTIHFLLFFSSQRRSETITTTTTTTTTTATKICETKD